MNALFAVAVHKLFSINGIKLMIETCLYRNLQNQKLNPPDKDI
jgi:hypothetical protein